MEEDKFDKWFEDNRTALEMEYLEYAADEISCKDQFIEAIESDKYFEWCEDKYNEVIKNEKERKE